MNLEKMITHPDKVFWPDEARVQDGCETLCERWQASLACAVCNSRRRSNSSRL
jgi:hypothetical protein